MTKIANEGIPDRWSRPLSTAAFIVGRLSLALFLIAVGGGCTATNLTYADCEPCFTARLDPARSAPAACRTCFAIRKRHPSSREPDSLRGDFVEEYAYIGNRRRQLGVVGGDNGANIPVPANLTGVALSGGGIRSASFNLGAMQALLDADALDTFDYMSAVSGGGYLAGWMQNHLGARQQLYRDALGYEVGTDEMSSLLANSGDQVEQLRTHARFIQGSSWFEGPKVFLQWLVRWPAHLIIDDLLHLRGGWNFQHIIGIYRERIEDTYFRGTPPPSASVPPKAEMPLVEVNDPLRSKLTPYMILNANLLNSGASQLSTATEKIGTDSANQWNFEFTRDVVGSDGIGYIDARGFNRGVDYVLRDGSGQPMAAVMEDGDGDVSDFRLSSAVATSGAAFDSLAGVPLVLDTAPLKQVGQLLAGAVLNLYLGYDAPNFAARFNGNEEAVGYVNMMTWERVSDWVGTGASWLYITDGGHYENLGALALLRRGAKCVVQFDAGADAEATYGDLHVLRQRVETDLKMRWITALPEKGDARGRYRFAIAEESDPTTPTAVILYVKANANPELPHMRSDFGTSPSARGAAFDRQVSFIERDDVNAIRAFTATAAQAQTRRGVAQLDAAAEKAERATAAYYAEVIRNEREVDQRRAAAADSVASAWSDLTLGDDRMAALLRVQEQLCRYGGRLCITDLDQGDFLAAVDPSEAARLKAEQRDLCGVRARHCSLPFDGRELEPLAGETAISELMHEVESVRQGIVEVTEEIETQRAWNAEQRRKLQEKRDRLVLASVSPDVDEAHDESDRAYEQLLRQVPKGDAAAQQFEAATRRNASRLERALKENRAWTKRVEDRAERIAKIRAFANSSQARDFPHTETLLQWYDWERFEAYRLLGFQMASTYLEQLHPGEGLDWCRFAPLPPGEEDRFAARPEG